jgi:hypothetical protein
MDAQRSNFPLAGVHYSKALKADPTRNSVASLGQIFLQQGMFEPALTRFRICGPGGNSAPVHQGIHMSTCSKTREAEEALTKAVALIPPAGSPTIYRPRL